jgi:hypothetical protein
LRTSGHGHELLIGALTPQESVRFLEDDCEVRKWVSFDDDVYQLFRKPSGGGLSAFAAILGF